MISIKINDIFGKNIIVDLLGKGLIKSFFII